ncbi:MAG TPA: glycosyltransferase family 2 protein [Acidimicrobiales bacterium]|nr:glycosyltransferase family 2 protein [Acidimicrobiales bacterium]
MSRRPDQADDVAPAPTAPPVVAVVVTHDPGPWLEESLAALDAQDYPNLSVLVLDAASADDPTPRVAAALPGAYIRRLDDNAGFAAAANEVQGLVEGASHYVFLHDDAAPDPDAVRLLVEEGFRSNAGVVAPKLVAWDDPAQLLAVGGTADKSGTVTLYGRGELDQEQHDAVRDVFVAPGGCQLVRADLFSILGGFDADVPLFGEDLDLCWRAQVAGARVVVAPSARVRHLEATAAGIRALELDGADDRAGRLDVRIARLQLRHRLRTVLKDSGPVHLLRVLPQILAILFAEALLALASRRRTAIAAVADAVRWNVAHRAGLRVARRDAQSHRALKDADVRRLQRRGGTRLSAALRGGLAVEERTFGVAAAGRQLVGAVTSGGTRLTVGVWAGVALVLLAGTRGLVAGRLPAVGQLVAFPESPFTFLRMFASGWRTAGVGSEAPAPVAFALFGGLGVVLVGAMGLLQKLAVLGMIPLGIVGMHRLTGPLASWRARLVAVVLYAALPLPYGALADGRWDALVAYAAAPWIVARVLRASGLPPFGGAAPAEEVHRRARRPHTTTPADAVEALLGAEAGTLDAIDAEELRVAAIAVSGRHDDEGVDVVAPVVPGPARPPRRGWEQAVALGVLLAVAGAVAPPVVTLGLVVAFGALLGSVVAGGVREAARAFAVAVGGVLVAGVLLAPWTLELALAHGGWHDLLGAGVAPSDAPGLGRLLRFDVGPLHNGLLGWGFLVAAGLPLAVGRRWRFAWATRLWAIAIVVWGVTWAAARGWLGVHPPAVDVLLTPAAVALVLAAALGLAAFERDLPGYRFGYRQLLSIIAAVAALVVTLPILVAALDGRWYAPAHDFGDVVSWMGERKAEGAFRVLWVGQPRSLPVDGWPMGSDLAFGTSRDGFPDATTLWSGGNDAATRQLADAVGLARRGETSKLGHLLAPLGVRYVAVPTSPAPARDRAGALDVPADLTDALGAQIDLRKIDSDPALVVYENAAWGPMRAVLPPAAADASRRSGLDAARVAELHGAAPVLPAERGPTTFTGTVPGPSQVYVAEAASSRWHLDVVSRPTPRRTAFGWANAFTVPYEGPGRLHYVTSPLRWLALLVELALWIVAVRIAARRLRRRRPGVQEVAA